MTGRGLGVTAVVAALLLTAPTAVATPPAPPRPPDPRDVAFIGHLADHGVPYASAPAAITLAQVACTILTTGSPTRIENAVRTIRDQITLRPDRVQSFAETAVSVYCPSCADHLGLNPGPPGPASATPEAGSTPPPVLTPPRKPRRAGH